MAISVQPVDGLINRLLQQNSRPSSAAGRRADSQMHATQDQVSISAQAQSQQDALPAAAEQQNRSGGKALESHLLKLYKMNDSSGV